jgi:hypothetical protein
MRGVIVRSYASNMKQPNYRIVPLATDVADKARHGAQAGASDHARVIADARRANPCRHCLEWAEIGEEMILFPYASVETGAYREIGPIFVHARQCERYSKPEECPQQFAAGRVVRAYDRRSFMIDARVANGATPDAVIEELLENGAAAFLHVCSVARGCYTFRVERI